MDFAVDPAVEGRQHVVFARLVDTFGKQCWWTSCDEFRTVGVEVCLDVDREEVTLPLCKTHLDYVVSHLFFDRRGVL